MSPVIKRQGESAFQGRKRSKAPRIKNYYKREPTEKSAFSLILNNLRLRGTPRAGTSAHAIRCARALAPARGLSGD